MRNTGEYQAGRQARARQINKTDWSGSQCPFPPSQFQPGYGASRVEWLLGYYDQAVDESELKARTALGLRLVNIDVEAEQQTGQGEQKAKRR